MNPPQQNQPMRQGRGSFVAFLLALPSRLLGRAPRVRQAYQQIRRTKVVSDFFTMMEKLQGLFESEEIEVKTRDGRTVRGKIDNLRSTQPFSKPAVKLVDTDGNITKILFDDIQEITDRQSGSPPS